ncbi:MAG: biosynthetic arginine decarboxylase [Deltaproteobacteria bacterium]|nr:biosynthetic arginine decarboxylase [Deltaproteobacteria bacterium]
MSTRQVIASKELYGIDEWGAGYFSINRAGHVICTPTDNKEHGISLPEVVEEAKNLGVRSPMILRFPQIIRGQLEKMHCAFSAAKAEFGYTGKHFGVFPFKVNQRREFIDAIVSCGKPMHWGLEVGSKTEFMAALSYPMEPDALLICNGFKDPVFVQMAFHASEMGRNVVLVAEGPDELEYIIQYIRDNQPEKSPGIGLRVRLYAKGSGKWEKSSGESSKFGLTTIELIHALDLLENAGLRDELVMLHFHIGSQITAIKRFKNALKEAARVYAKIVKLGFAPTHLNIGGGVGVDYDGSHTSAQSSANYSLQEFANDAVYVVGEVCKNEGVQSPHIITESGRVIAAYHSIVVTDIREVQGEESLHDIGSSDEIGPGDAHKPLKELEYILAHMSSKNYMEFYHDAVEFHEDLFTLFNLGYTGLRERAIAEELFHKICRRALYFASFQTHFPDEFEALQKLKVSKYLANFSIFQSIPDAWSIGQLFPVIPLSRHDEKPSHKGTIVDITCDSDGCLDRFVDRKEEKSTLDLHSPNGNPYYLGFFLVGAYQESLANEHNLLGAINEVEVYLNEEDGSWSISKTTQGDPIRELLICRNYDAEEMIRSYENQLLEAKKKGLISPERSTVLLEQLTEFLDHYPYLTEKN